jgi:hypothetical protein
MKKQSFSKIFLFLIATGALLVTTATDNKALAHEYDNAPAAPDSVFASGLHDGGRLVIRRHPQLGHILIVTLTIDGVPAKGIAYGQIYDSFLRPGRHVLSVIAAPRPRFNIPFKTTLDVQLGRTYYFTAVSQSSQVILKRTSH